MNFEMKDAQVGPIAFLQLRGIYRPEDAPSFKACFQKYLDANYKLFLLDLHELTYISSSGLRSILELQKALMACGGELRLVKPVSFILDVFTTTHMDEVMAFYDTAPLAVYDWIAREAGKAEPPRPSGK